MHPAAPSAPTNVTIRLPGGDGKAVQHGGAIRPPVAGDDVVGVRPLDIRPRFGDEVAIAIEVVLVNISTQDGEICRPIALLAASLRAEEAAVAVVAAVVFITRGQRRIPVQYAKRVVGRRVYGGQTTHLPLRVNTAGVIPVIFASSIIAFPQTIASFFQANLPWMQSVAEQLTWGMPLYNILYVSFIIFFCYFYTAIVFNPDDVAENMRKYGGFIPGIRPGKRTSEYLDHILGRITFGGAIYLALVAILPEFLITGFKVAPIPVIGPPLDMFLSNNNLGWITEGLHLNFYFGGTSLLIVVGVAMDTLQQIESQLVMRNYEGFLKRGRIRGRRG